MNSNYQSYIDHLRKLADVMYASAVLQWDQETYMPAKGAAIRGQQLATLAGISHELSVDPQFGKLLETLEKDGSLNEKQQRNVKQSLKDYRDRNKYTTAFVQELTMAVSEAFAAWDEAKSQNDFSIYQPKLEKIVALKRREAELLGYSEHPYDALIDQYEPGTKTSDIDRLFADVKKELKPFIDELLKKKEPREDFMYRNYSTSKQWDLGIELLKQMGYDFEAGRQDVSSHPFTIHFNAEDVRVTTRTNENNLHEMIWSTIHEGGHALYEQGIPLSEYGLPSGEACSLAVHESQSRLWENIVGRSLDYWKANWNLLGAYFANEMKDVSPEEFYAAMNLVRPSLIRTNADELTYHFHILIRFEIEKALMEGSLEVKDLPAAWNKKYKEYLNIDVPSDKEGVLQDIHWAHGSIGYFPTYSLGSFYSAQLYAAAVKSDAAIPAEIAKGNMKPLLKWLRENIHVHGKTYAATELIERATGEKPDFRYFMNYAREKYRGIYS
ncbi:MAG: carboxypeptidase M32 [Flavobacteriales bacterium]|nr:carboxypeptidase M32 [Flavobacteriales bacterium]